MITIRQNLKSYMGSPTAPLDLTLSDLEMISQISKSYLITEPS